MGQLSLLTAGLLTGEDHGDDGMFVICSESTIVHLPSSPHQPDDWGDQGPGLQVHNTQL